MTSKEVIGRDAARKEASASSIATATAAMNGSKIHRHRPVFWRPRQGGGGANADDANTALGYGDDYEASKQAAAPSGLSCNSLQGEEEVVSIL
jgi:hypothetical protein